MSVTTYGLDSGSYLPQADWDIRDDPNGGASATQSFLMRRSTWLLVAGDFAKGVTASSLDTNLGAVGDAMTLDHIERSNEAGNLLRVTAFYAGFAADYDDEKDEVPTYVLRGMLSEKSICEHSELLDATVNDTDRQLVSKIADGDLDWNFTTNKVTLRELPEFEYDDQPSAGIATAFCELAAKGKISYLAPSFTWEKSWSSKAEIPVADINNLGKVDVPDGSPPTPNGARDWLMTDASQMQRGQLYRNRIEWMLSERIGWDDDLYNY